MKEKVAHLESLARMTVENSSEGRQQLLHEITDMFMEQPDQLSEREVAYFGEIMGGIVGGVETMVRQHLAETVSTVSNAPQDLIVSLANDEIEVALPVLTHSEVLNDDDLVKIVNEKGQEHMQAISSRETVSETVTDVLVKKGDDTVLGTLADNNGAQFSRGGMETMFDRAKENDDLNKSLAARQDVPDDLAQDMFWRVSWAVREQILEDDPSLEETQVNALMEEAEAWFKDQKGKKALNPAEKFIIRKDKLGQLDTGLLLSLIREEKVPEFVAGLGCLAKIDTETAQKAVFDPSAEKLAIVCKALEMDYDVFGEVLYLSNFENDRSAEDTETLLGVYKRFSPQVAQRALRFLRTRISMQAKTAAG